MNPELEPEENIDAGFSHQINLEEIPENNNTQFSHQTNPEFEEFIADLRSKIQESGDTFSYTLEIPNLPLTDNPELGKVNILSEFAAKRYYKEEDHTDEGIVKIGDMKYLLYELSTNMYNYDENGTKIITIEGNFKDGRLLKIIGRGEGPKPEELKSVESRDITKDIHELKPGTDEDLDSIINNLDLPEEDINHGRGLISITRLAEMDHLSVVLEKTPEGTPNPTYAYTILDSPDRNIELSDLERIAA